MPASEWAWKLVVIALSYLILYFTFGYYIAWRNPAVLEYYRGIDEGSFLVHMGTVRARYSPGSSRFRSCEQCCWVALALPVIQMPERDSWPETALSIAIAVFRSDERPLLLPNPYMPEPVRMAHLVETASSNFIFGALIGWLLTPREAFEIIAISGPSAFPPAYRL